ncbi:MAG: hypothetical protein Q8R12_03325 [bacterium]|nr:hypothetical protein [bacterium]
MKKFLRALWTLVGILLTVAPIVLWLLGSKSKRNFVLFVFCCAMAIVFYYSLGGSIFIGLSVISGFVALISLLQPVPPSHGDCGCEICQRYEPDYTFSDAKEDLVEGFSDLIRELAPCIWYRY